MCGIVAVWQRNIPVNRERLSVAIQTLHHRGPDDQQTWVSPNQHVGLAHARLSIVDLTTGSQPLHSSDGMLHTIVNGEFYDDDQIRLSFQKEGYEFSTRTDSEILLPLYLKHGLKCFSYLNGEFAFVLWDEKNQQLIAARDRFGIKPLYYTQHQGNLYFASEIKALLALGIPAEWNDNIYWQTCYNLPSANQTCFKHIFQIKPGHYLLATSADHIIEKKYWDLSFPRIDNTQHELSEAQYIEQFRILFARAVKRRLRSDVPVACYLSGGIDSSSVFIEMAEHTTSPITAFNVAFEEASDLNEFKFAKATAEHACAHFQSLPVTIEDIATHYEKTIWHTELFTQHGSAVAKFLLSKYVRDHGYKVVLTGEGPDELLGGYMHLWLDCVKYSNHPENKSLHQSIQEILQKEIFQPSQYFSEKRKTIENILGYYPDIIQPIDNSTASLLHPDFLKKYKNRHAHLALLRSIPNKNKIHPGNMSLYLQCKTIFPVATLNIVGDRTEMAHSLEGRQPFLDTELAEFLASLPVHFKARGMIEKYILRQAMKNKLPRNISKKEKHPFLSPTFVYKNKQLSPLYQLMRDVFHSDLLNQVPFINRAAVINLIDSIPQMNKSEIIKWEPYLHMILSSCFLAKLFRL